MSLQDFLPVIEVLRWPAAVVVIAVVGFAVFRAAINRLLDRTRKISRDGVEVEAAEQAERLQAQGGPEVPKLPTWSEANQSPMLIEEMTRLRKVLSERIPAGEQDERETLLIAALAESGITINFLHIYRLIYGSQLDALDFISSFSPTKPEQLDHFYDFTKTELPEVTFEAWLDFLVTNVLVLRDEDGLTITVKGREFLAFLARAGLRGIPKPY
jgi:hypothetical protein